MSTHKAKNPTVGEYTTKGAHTIAPHCTLEEAHKLMRELEVRHLPVLDGGKVVGIVSQRDLHLIETLRDVDPSKVEVGEAMTDDPYTVDPDAPLCDVARTMAGRHLGAALVKARGEVLGIFTTTDALRALADATQPPAPAKKAS